MKMRTRVKVRIASEVRRLGSNFKHMIRFDGESADEMMQTGIRRIGIKLVLECAGLEASAASAI